MPLYTRARRLTAWATTAVAALALAACGGGGSSEAGGKLVYNVGSALPTVVMSPYAFVPQTEDFWKDAGVDVDVEYADGSTAALQLLLSGRADIVQSGTDAAYSSAEKNPSLRVVSVITQNVWRIGVPESSPIESIQDLKGKKVGVISLTSGTYTFGRSIVKSAGLDPDKDVEWLPIGTGTQAAEALDSGRVDAYSSYDGPLDIAGTVTQETIRPIPSALDDVPGSLAYVTTDEVLKNRREDLVAFLKGTYEGQVFGLTNPDAAIQIYWDQVPDQAPAEADRESALANAREIVKNSWSNRFAVGDDDLRGYLSTDRIQKAADFFEQYQITEGSADVSTVVDLGLAEDANDFDQTAIEELAKSWTP